VRVDRRLVREYERFVRPVCDRHDVDVRELRPTLAPIRVRENVVPVTKPEITIGRGSRSITVDLPLKGDPEISRVHAILTREGDGRYYLQAKGRNSTLVGSREIPTGERMEVQPDQKIGICNFVLRIQPN